MRMNKIIENDDIMKISATEWIRLITFIDKNKITDQKNKCYYIENLQIRNWIAESDINLKFIIETTEKILSLTRLFLEGERKTKRVNNKNQNRLYFSECSALRNVRKSNQRKLELEYSF